MGWRANYKEWVVLGFYFLQTLEGWVHVFEGAYSESVGFWMNVFDMAGERNLGLPQNGFPIRHSCFADKDDLRTKLPVPKSPSGARCTPIRRVPPVAVSYPTSLQRWLGPVQDVPKEILQRNAG